MSIKQIAKAALYYALPTDLAVLSGPARGARLRLDLRCEGRYWLGRHETWLREHVRLEDYLKPGGVAWDCGAYIGYYTACYRRLVGPTGQVHAFEASLQNYERLKVLPLINDWPNVQVHHVAIGPDHTTLEFVDGLRSESGLWRPGKQYADGSRAMRWVQSCGLDELAYEKGVATPQFIKLDLEGAEEFAIQSGPRLFAEQRPVVLAEVHTSDARANVGRFLEQYRYSARVLSEPNNAARRSLGDFGDLSGEWHMMLCVPD